MRFLEAQWKNIVSINGEFRSQSAEFVSSSVWTDKENCCCLKNICKCHLPGLEKSEAILIK